MSVIKNVGDGDVDGGSLVVDDPFRGIFPVGVEGHWPVVGLVDQTIVVRFAAAGFESLVAVEFDDFGVELKL